MRRHKDLTATKVVSFENAEGQVLKQEFYGTQHDGQEFWILINVTPDAEEKTWKESDES